MVARGCRRGEWAVSIYWGQSFSLMTKRALEMDGDDACTTTWVGVFVVFWGVFFVVVFQPCCRLAGSISASSCFLCLEWGQSEAQLSLLLEKAGDWPWPSRLSSVDSCSLRAGGARGLGWEEGLFYLFAPEWPQWIWRRILCEGPCCSFFFFSIG